jgi:dynein heavy chain 2
MLQQDDPRLQALLKWIECSFPRGVVQKYSQQISSSVETEKFIEDGNCTILELCIVDDKLIINNVISFPPNCTNEIHMIKSKSDPLDESDFTNGTIQFGSLKRSSPSDNLLNTLHNVYGPLLLANKNYSGDFNPLLQNLLTELESGLSSFVRKEKVVHKEDQEFFFLTPQEEFQYWSEASGNNEYAASIDKSFRNLKLYDKFARLDQSKLEDLTQGSENIISDVHTALESVWEMEVARRTYYPQRRMDRLLSVIASSFGRLIQLKLSQTNFWTDEYATVKKSIEQALEICYEWKSVVSLLMGDWSQNVEHKWQGVPHDDPLLNQLAHRLDQILSIRTGHEQVLQNLTEQERGDLQVDSAFAPFSNLVPLHISTYTEQLWNVAVEKYQDSRVPLERRISEKLRSKLSQLGDKPQLLLIEFQRNKELIKKPNVKKELSQERSTFLGHLRSHVKTLRNDFENLSYVDNNRNSTTFEAGKSMTELVNRIVCGKQIEDKLLAILSTARTFLDDLSGTDALNKECQQLENDLTEFFKDQFAKWTKEVDSRIKKDGLAADLKGNMIKIDKGKNLMVVNYNERLVSLIRESRQLTILGFKIPQEVQKLCTEANDFYAQAMTLKQIANFYNNVHTQVIKSQSAMLIEPASLLETVVQKFEKNKREWNKKEGEKYIAQLKDAAEKFTAENRKLRKYHLMISERVSQLFNIDLLRFREKWLDQVSSIIKVFAQLESENYKNMDGWKIHWDYQIYKALEHQYQLGLESLNENLPEIKVDVVFKDKQIQFSPTFEKLREIYFEKMREFISFPEIFEGITGGAGGLSSGVKNKNSIFRQMIYRNKEGLFTVYKKASQLFSRLKRAQSRFVDYVVLGTVESLTQLVEEQLQETPQWEVNFKMVKEKGKEVERIENIIKIDCVSLSTQPIKAAIDDQLQKMGDALVRSLRMSAQLHLTKVETFIANSQKSLAVEPQSMDEIGESQNMVRQLGQEKKSIYAEFEKFEAKNKLLRSVSGNFIDPTSCKDKWNDFEDTLTAHDKFLQERTSNLKKDIESKIVAFMNGLSKFSATWNETKPKNTQYVDKEKSKQDIARIKERRHELDDMKASAAQLQKECEYFGIRKQNMPELDDVEADIAKYEILWAIYQEYMEAIEKFIKEEWIGFKKRVFEFEDFIQLWLTRIKKEDVKSSVVVHIRSELESFNQFKDMVKYIQGEGWTPEHWSQLFRIIKIENIPFEKLLFGQLLDRAENVIESLAEIKELNSRAQGEDQIRVALHELRVWETTTEFTIAEYTDNPKKRVPLIKEWKEVMTKLGDHMSMIQAIADHTYASLFSDDIKTWEEKLTTLDFYLTNLMQIQRKWLYLEPIFSKGALPSEAQRFNNLDRDFVGIMQQVGADRRVANLGKLKLKDKLKTLLTQLDHCQKALSDFLEIKRTAFPRFYFIGDDDMLEILGQAQNPSVIQTHLRKLFAGIHSVKFNDSKTRIIAIMSAEGEEVKLSREVTITERVEEWLQ